LGENVPGKHYRRRAQYILHNFAVKGTIMRTNNFY